ncbi:putative ABC transporter ATP-binding protein YlmA [Paenibacillus sp. J31TS4]|uniref:ABC transporter ATP-binding protein n=1 Tax=Paenibacillus sp. J31TS4 TaxID=2807195 RepID=UPI001AFDB6E5|nr:ABC transporter ATP-binding protein [Paenibacillus sp. J31TS4]GIP37305.1 putative ABC transporter ATP-binding protein YlmA [Paenibacillus sp. J31TS4]
MIRLKDIYFRREQRDILTDIQLTVNEGEHWVILGRNGSGKTTILELLNGYQFPSSGTVEVLGKRYGTVDIREARKSIGYISSSLYDKLTPRDPVWEVVATGEYGYLRFYQDIPDETIAKAEAMLARVGLTHVKDQLLGTLSQGERKKILLARALMLDPAILIMDEPCSGLDLFEREKLLNDINNLKETGVTVVYVTHHIEEIMPIFTHAALLENGKLVAAGPKTAVLTEENLLQAFQVPVRLEWENGRPWIQVRGTAGISK